MLRMMTNLGHFQCRALLVPLDRQGLLKDATPAPVTVSEEMDDDALLAELGVDAESDGVTELRHVRSTVEKRAAEEIANRRKCDDFDATKPMFIQVKKDLDNGIRRTRPFQTKNW
jgi:DNA-binding FadR family transcriptional regulator